MVIKGEMAVVFKTMKQFDANEFIKGIGSLINNCYDYKLKDVIYDRNGLKGKESRVVLASKSHLKDVEISFMKPNNNNVVESVEICLIGRSISKEELLNLKTITEWSFDLKNIED